MATTVTISTNYAGEVAAGIIGKTFLEADTLRLGLIKVYPNVGNKLNMRRIRYTDGRVAYSCGFNPQGSIVLNERVLEPVKLKNEFQLCKEDFRAQWSQNLMGASAHNDNLPSDIREAIMTEMLGETAEDIDAMIWTGDNSANTNEWTGFLPLFEADADVIKVNGVASTEANVLAELKKALAAVPRALRRKGVSVGVSSDIFQNYTFYLISQGIANDGNADDKQAKFGKYTLTEINGLPDSTIVIFEKENLGFGTGLEEDFNEIVLKDEDEIGLLTGMVRGKMVYSGGVQYANSEEIVYYRIDPTP